MSMTNRIKSGEFENTKRLHNELNDPAFIAIASQITYATTLLKTAEDAQKALRQERRQDFQAGEAAATARFRVALEEEFEMTDHPNRYAIWDMAAVPGHPIGHLEILEEYEYLMNLTK